MRRGFLLLLLAAPLRAAVSAEEAQRIRSTELAGHYETALQFYTKRDFSRAVMEWREILRLAPDQSSAEKMIGLAREEIDKRDREKQDVVYAKAAFGDYAGALVSLQTLLQADPLHPAYVVLQARLDRISFVVPTVSTDTKAWQAAVSGLSGYLAREEDLPLAYDGLRLAKELDAKEPLFDRLISVLLADNPSLAQDALTPGMGLIEYKRYVALNNIYDGKYAQAAVVLERVLKLAPEDDIALKRLGSAYFAMREKGRARTLWERALKRRPDDAQLKEFLSRVELPAAEAAAALP
ncbi:MAG: tetratricopeptide repeat protein [Elusimicrobia bacterium]|nr:tetratricopeptide repeat protein [Elusimicrobiota bacterium]